MFFKEQVRHLIIQMGDVKKRLMIEIKVNIFTRILNTLSNLNYFKFISLSDDYEQHLSFERNSPKFFSSNLLELHVHVCDFNDCLYLLDGHFEQLRTFNIIISSSLLSSPKFPNQVSFLRRKKMI